MLSYCALLGVMKMGWARLTWSQENHSTDLNLYQDDSCSSAKILVDLKFEFDLRSFGARSTNQYKQGPLLTIVADSHATGGRSRVPSQNPYMFATNAAGNEPKRGADESAEEYLNWKTGFSLTYDVS
ncbi:uncharacterized protein BT62DRAFT_1013386 [Guyanagaster necrorhizus]|uniref:Uncharacterized protein n=1 Tax=Guyanagaster necrorhizus TaxID=856835 RepID=A0A9P7VF81_9AGAR|nr:uncharacterized protein BT62DRAFT_1013386 [Guyanagaster necrorhizus MCA 3950]KAG7439843.1 hypothetical protein BT62DRAFT_1013386 [Guyanagaster necrorhizus MCA 3950]